jgi:hypothetical protein
MRTWKVAHSSVTEYDRKVITRYFITDANTNDELETRAVAAEFPVSQKFDQDLQEERAHAYADYLNKIEEATKQAYANNQLIDILKA